MVRLSAARISESSSFIFVSFAGGASEGVEEEDIKGGKSVELEARNDGDLNGRIARRCYALRSLEFCGKETVFFMLDRSVFGDVLAICGGVGPQVTQNIRDHPDHESRSLCGALLRMALLH